MACDTLATHIVVGTVLALVWASVALAQEKQRHGAAMRGGEVERLGKDSGEMVYITGS